MPAHIRKTLTELQTVTEKCSGFQLNVCLSYGGRDEIVQACRRVADDSVSGRIENTKSIDETLFSKYLTTTNGKFHLSLTHSCMTHLTSTRLSSQLNTDPDLLIRTSGECRLSNFLPWQLTYAELLFVEKLWPELTRTDLRLILAEYARRHRRYGT